MNKQLNCPSITIPIVNHFAVFSCKAIRGGGLTSWIAGNSRTIAKIKLGKSAGSAKQEIL